jgi:hypothetical protein
MKKDMLILGFKGLTKDFCTEIVIVVKELKLLKSVCANLFLRHLNISGLFSRENVMI